jgi:hypothetical protein
MTPHARRQPRRVHVRVLLLVAWLCTNVSAQDHRLAEPFNTFRSLDSQLSRLDAQFSHLRKESEQVSKISNRNRRAKRYRQLHRSESSRELRSTVSSIGATVRKLSSSTTTRKSGYGRILTRALTRRAKAMQGRLDYVVKAETNKQARLSMRKFADAMLAFVLQFQAVAGGYGALQCEPGNWTCCGRKRVRSASGAALHGCMWLCVQRRAACRSGCLGPRTPVIARRHSIYEPRPTAAPRPPSPANRSPSSAK